jgi:hypothetical protein
MIAHQELNDVAGVATLGGASSRLEISLWGDYLQLPRVILAIYDPDRAGKQGARALAEISRRIHPVRVPVLRTGDKDINDYYLAGGDLWQWLKYTLGQENLLNVLGVADHAIRE